MKVSCLEYYLIPFSAILHEIKTKGDLFLKRDEVKRNEVKYNKVKRKEVK